MSSTSFQSHKWHLSTEEEMSESLLLILKAANLKKKKWQNWKIHRSDFIFADIIWYGKDLN